MALRAGRLAALDVAAALQVDVRGQHVLAAGERPAVYVVDVVNFGYLQDPLFYLFCVDVFRRLLHEYGVAVLGNLYGGREHDDGEHDREDGVQDNV